MFVHKNIRHTDREMTNSVLQRCTTNAPRLSSDYTNHLLACLLTFNTKHQNNIHPLKTQKLVTVNYRTSAVTRLVTHKHVAHQHLMSQNSSTRSGSTINPVKMFLSSTLTTVQNLVVVCGCMQGTPKLGWRCGLTPVLQGHVPDTTKTRPSPCVVFGHSRSNGTRYAEKLGPSFRISRSFKIITTNTD